MANNVAAHRRLLPADIAEESLIKFGVYLLRLDDGQHVFKPADNPYKEFDDYTNEVAAFLLSEYFFPYQSLVSIPLTVLATYKGQVGSLQRYVEGHRPPDDLEGISSYQLHLSALFDWITNNTDRNLAGLLMAPGQQLHLIDHGSTFTRSYPCRSVLVRTATARASVSAFTAYYALDCLQRHKGAIYDDLRSLVAIRHIDAMYARVASLSEGEGGLRVDG